MYFSFFKLKEWGKKTAAARRHNCAVLPKENTPCNFIFQHNRKQLHFVMMTVFSQTLPALRQQPIYSELPWYQRLPKREQGRLSPWASAR